MIGFRRILWGWGVAAAACAALFSGQFVYGVEPPGPKDVTVRLIFPDGQPAQGATVTADRRTFVSDGDGIVKTVWTPSRPGPGVVSGETSRMEGGLFGFFRKQVRYAGFLTLDPASASPIDVRLSLVPVADMDSACRSCHPEKVGGGRGPMVKCAHRSGIPIKPAQVARVEQFNMENEELRKAGKPSHPGIVIEGRKAGGWFSDRKMYLACTSCHSNHVKTGQRAYVLMPFAEKSVLCKGCHV